MHQIRTGRGKELFFEVPIKIKVSHSGGGIARYLPRIRGLQIVRVPARRIFHGIPGCHASHLIIIYSIGCFTIVPDGQVPTMRPSEALNGYASAWPNCRLRGSYLPLTILRRFVTTMRWLHTLRP